MPRANCLRLFWHWARAADSRTFCTAGTKRPMRMAMMAITTNSSISVKAARDREFLGAGRVPFRRDDFGEDLAGPLGVAVRHVVVIELGHDADAVLADDGAFLALVGLEREAAVLVGVAGRAAARVGVVRAA